MRKFNKTLLALSTSVLLAGGTAMAETEIVNPDVVPVLKRHTFELNPLSFLVSLSPNINAVSASYERYTKEGWAYYLGLGYADGKLRSEWRDDAREEFGGAILVEGDGSTVELGARYYEDPIGDSFYGSGAVSYAEGRSTWTYRDNEISSKTWTATPSLSAGYRWVWKSGFMMRGGLGAGLPHLAGENVRASNQSADAQEGVRKVKDINDQLISPKADFSIGYTF